MTLEDRQYLDRLVKKWITRAARHAKRWGSKLHALIAVISVTDDYGTQYTFDEQYTEPKKNRARQDTGRKKEMTGRVFYFTTSEAAEYTRAKYAEGLGLVYDQLTDTYKRDTAKDKTA